MIGFQRRVVLAAMGVAAIAFFGASMPRVASGASQDECAIWLCLPQAFIPSGCKRARRALIKRVTPRPWRPAKPPLPAFRECAVRGGIGPKIKTRVVDRFDWKRGRTFYVDFFNEGGDHVGRVHALEDGRRDFFAPIQAWTGK